MLALVLQGDPLAIEWIMAAAPSNTDPTYELPTCACACFRVITKHSSFALEIASKKINSYMKFNNSYPGFGGFLPWFTNTDDGIELLSGWFDTVPALDNGQLAWSLVVITDALKGINRTLYHQYKDYLQMLKNNS
jgi:hypothetical protein